MSKPSIIPRGMTLEGELAGEGDIVIFGQVLGEIHTEGFVVIETSGSMRGPVHARAVTIRGRLLGDVFARECAHVDAGATVVGDLAAPRVRVVEGARFRGRVIMGEAPHLASAGSALAPADAAPPESSARRSRAASPPEELSPVPSSPISSRSSASAEEASPRALEASAPAEFRMPLPRRVPAKIRAARG
ncbi:MAG: polymer-forming cytoskeletal protein [Myxococcales bacterium]|nr:polymer-forming cytoskeletal protein [Myxococcales bacterium]